MKKFLVILVLINFISCSTKKKVIRENETIKIESNENVDTNIKVSEVNIKIDTTKINEIIYSPIDTSKPMIVKGKEFKNVSIKEVLTQKGISISKVKDSVLNQRKTLSNSVNINKEKVDKDIERFNWSYLIILIIIIFGWFIYKRFK